MAENGNDKEYTATSQDTTNGSQSTRDIVSEGEFNSGGLSSVWGSYENYKEGRLSGSIGENVSFDVNVENVENGCAQLGKTSDDFETSEKAETETYKAALDTFFGIVGGSTEDPPAEKYTNLCADIYLLKQDMTSIKENLVEYANSKDETLFGKDSELLSRFGFDSDFTSMAKTMAGAKSGFVSKVLGGAAIFGVSLLEGFGGVFEDIGKGALILGYRVASGVSKIFTGKAIESKGFTDFIQKDWVVTSVTNSLYDQIETWSYYTRDCGGAKVGRFIGAATAYGLLAQASVAAGSRVASGAGKVVTKIAPKIASKIATKMPAVVTKIATGGGKVLARGAASYVAGSGSGTETALQNGASLNEAIEVGITQGNQQAATEMIADVTLRGAGALLNKTGIGQKVGQAITNLSSKGGTIPVVKATTGAVAAGTVKAVVRGTPAAYSELLTNNKIAVASQNAANVPSNNEPSTTPGTSADPNGTSDPGTQWGNGGGGGGYTPTPTPSTEAPTAAPTTETPTVAPTDPPKDDPGTVIGSTGNGGNDFSGEGMSFDADIDDTEILDDIDTGEDLDPSDSIITIPTTIKSATTKNTKSNSVAGPVLGALGVAAAAGIGAKVYMDNKANNTNGEEDEEYDEYEDSGINADEWNDDGIGATTDSDESYLMYDKNSLDDLELGTSEI